MTTETSDSGSGGGVGFICPDLPEGDDCQTRYQDCPPDEKCVAFYSEGEEIWEGRRCVPVPPKPAAVGDPCEVEGHVGSGFDNCGAGLLCLANDDTLEGICAEYCRKDLPPPPEATEGDTSKLGCDDPTKVCTQPYCFGSGICLANCNPLLSDCPGELQCVFNHSLVCQPKCRDDICLEFCEDGDDEACSGYPDEVCRFFGAAQPDYGPPVGYCGPPP